MAATESRLAAMLGTWEGRGFVVSFRSQGKRLGCRVETQAGEVAGWSWVEKGRMRPEADVKVEALRKAVYFLSRERRYG